MKKKAKKIKAKEKENAVSSIEQTPMAGDPNNYYLTTQTRGVNRQPPPSETASNFTPFKKSTMAKEPMEYDYVTPRKKN